MSIKSTISTVISVLCVFCLGLQEVSSHPVPYSRERMSRFLDTIQDNFETRYAPHDWKLAEYGWDLSAEIKKAKENIWLLPNITVADFQRIVRDLVYSTKDYHVGVYFYNTEMATLPFTIKKFGDSYYVTSVQAMACPLKPGDQILEFNGQDVNAEIVAIKKQITSSNPVSDQSQAENYFSFRVGFFGMSVPQGRVRVIYRDTNTGKIKIEKVRWRYYPNLIEEPPYEIKSFKEQDNTDDENTDHMLSMLGRSRKQQMLNPYFSQMEALKKLHGIQSSTLQGHPNEMGNWQGYLPNLGEIVWMGSNRVFNAYIFLDSAGRKIGYIRIPDYNGGPKGTEEFAILISKMENETEALIIDQQGNPGGSAFYMYSLLTLLTDKPMATPHHKIAITQEDVFAALQTLEEIKAFGGSMPNLAESDAMLDGYPATWENMALIEEYCHFIIEEWKEGNYITDPIYLSAIDEVLPHPSGLAYTKPILVLVNELDMSCGDFFPAILQDNGRAKIMGTRTGGAGGFVLQYRFDNPFGIAAISMTGSIAERPIQKKIENLGVTPDVEYQLTVEDLKNNYAPFMDAIQAEVAEMLK